MSLVQVDVDDQRGTAIVSAEGLSNEQWAEVRDSMEFGGKDVELKGARLLELPVWALLRARQDLRFALDRLKPSGVKASFTAEAIRVLKAATERERRPPPTETIDLVIGDELRDRGFTRTLKWYQERNVVKLLQLPAAATFSVPGAGKTTEALALYALRRTDQSRLLVICPKNAFAVWEEQVALCLPALRGRVTRLRGNAAEVEALIAGDNEVFLINYDLLQRHLKSLTKLCRGYDVSVYLDESHRVKAWPPKVTGSKILDLSPYAAERLVMSGTPLPNSTNDLLPQFAFLYPESKATGDDVLHRFSRIFVRTTKTELELPDIKRIPVPVPMSDAQHDLYKALSSDFAGSLGRLNARDRNAFRKVGRAVLRLIQAASEPALLLNTGMGHHDLVREATTEIGPKTLRACAIARGLALKGEKCIIWTTFVDNVKQISSLLADLNAEFIFGDVRTSEDDRILDSRESKIRRFRENRECYVLVANPATCAESISLHDVCHHAIYVDRSYNAAHFLQSEDRIHRLGLPKEQLTYSHILISPGTVDESVDRRLQIKVGQMAAFLTDPSLSAAPNFALDEEIEDMDGDDIADLRRLLGID